MEEQNNYLTRLLLHQEELMQNQMRESTSYRDDLLKLREISKNQQFEIAVSSLIYELGLYHEKIIFFEGYRKGNQIFGL